MTDATLWMASGGLMISAGLALLAWFAFWRQAPPIDGTREPSWMRDTGERPHVGAHRRPQEEAPPPPVEPVEGLERTGGAEEWMWRPVSPRSKPPEGWQRPPWL